MDSTQTLIEKKDLRVFPHLSPFSGPMSRARLKLNKDFGEFGLFIRKKIFANDWYSSNGAHKH